MDHTSTPGSYREIMPTVEVMRWDGTSKGVQPIVAWALAHGAQQVIHSNGGLGTSRPSWYLRIIGPRADLPFDSEHWIVWNGTAFDRYTTEQFHEKYEPVKVPSAVRGASADNAAHYSALHDKLNEVVVNHGNVSETLGELLTEHMMEVLVATERLINQRDKSKSQATVRVSLGDTDLLPPF